MSRNVTIDSADLLAILVDKLSTGISPSNITERDRFFRLVSAYQQAGNLAYRYVHYGDNKIAVIKAIRDEEGWGLKESKLWSEDSGQSITDRMAKVLIAAGAVIEDHEGYRIGCDSQGLYRKAPSIAW